MKKIALAGNPNVGKSTVFNALTGMKQHTGNWPGKTVANQSGTFTYKNEEYELFDLPGTYSLVSHSEEETIARDFLCFNEYEKVVVVCDALCLERNMNLVLQILEITPNVIVCVNLLDEAKKRGLQIDLNLLSKRLGVPVVGTSARNKKGIKELLELISKPQKLTSTKARYNKKIEEQIEKIKSVLEIPDSNKSKRFIALRLLSKDKIFYNQLEIEWNISLENNLELQKILEKENRQNLEDMMVTRLMQKAKEIVYNVVTKKDDKYDKKMNKIDKIVTSKLFGFPMMFLLLMLVFWITIVGANYPSQFLYDVLFKLEEPISSLFEFLHFPGFLNSLLVDGVYRTLAWVTSVMLPPMAIFFPLFGILEDLGYLPRIAFNLDKCFQKCKACGKQALCMMMGFGCNAAGVTGTRIIDSKRERLIAILTNSFVPCNGRFPTILAIISMFFIGFQLSFVASLKKVFLLMLVIVLGIIITLFISYFLSKTLLKGVPSSFTLELPPYRKPQIGKVLIRSLFDKTFHVLGRAVLVSIPAGALIFLLANTGIGGVSFLERISSFLDPFGKLIGLDGIILTAFILGFPANEIVIPIMIMAYLSLGSMVDYSSLEALKTILIDHGWTTLTAINSILICLFHFPCSTTCLTVKKETNSWYWTIVAFLLPTICGIILCILTTLLFSFL